VTKPRTRGRERRRTELGASTCNDTQALTLAACMLALTLIAIVLAKLLS
jgi:hypothetical protein